MVGYAFVGVFLESIFREERRCDCINNGSANASICFPLSSASERLCANGTPHFFGSAFFPSICVWALRCCTCLAGEAIQLLAGLQVPEPDRSVLADREGAPPVGGNGHVMDFPRMPLQAEDFLAGLTVP